MTPTVLFIDDDLTVRALAAALLERKGYRMMAALSASEADRILKRERIDLIICDIMMEGEDGIAYTRRLRERGERTPILILSAISQPAAIQKGLDAGANGYLVKPFEIPEFERRMMALLPPQEKKKPATPIAPAPPPSAWYQRLLHRKP